MTTMKVAIIMGSDSDLPVMEETAKILEQFEIPFDMRILSAHRTPEELEKHLDRMTRLGAKVFICGAGAAAHLAGAVAARVVAPVIGVPLDGSVFKGFDALLATVQMPGGIPVATVAVGKAGARNAGLLAVQILAVGDEKLAKGLEEQRQDQKIKIDRKNRDLKNKYQSQFRFLSVSDD